MYREEILSMQTYVPWMLVLPRAHDRLNMNKGVRHS